MTNRKYPLKRSNARRDVYVLKNINNVIDEFREKEPPLALEVNNHDNNLWDIVMLILRPFLWLSNYIRLYFVGHNSALYSRLYNSQD